MTERITLTSLSYGAKAIGRASSGKIVFVSNGCPGDVAEVEITKETPSFCEGVITSLIEPSAQRVPPVCPFAQSCGGCSWMHINYQTQLEAKRNHVVSQLNRIGGFPKDKAEELVDVCHASKRQVGYRNKLELSARYTNNGFSLGFHSAQSEDVVTPKTCPLAAKGITKAPVALQGALRYLQGTRDLGLFRVGIRHSLRTKDTEIALWTKPGPFPRKAVADTLSSALGCTSIVRVMADPGKARKIKGVESLYGKGFWSETLAETTFKVSAPSFFQVNTAQAEKMIQTVIEGLNITKESRVADLYCGVGSFTLPLAKRSKHVFAVESAASSVRDLRRNAQENNVSINVIGGDSARELPRLGNLDALIVDPPRAGLSKGVTQDIAKAAPEQVAYVSCDPATWARDIARFKAVGYELKRAIPYDLFPQTYHIETVSFLSRC